MKQPLFRRITALLLALSFVLGGGVIAVAADGNGGGSTSGSTLDDVRELLNAVSYQEYAGTEIFKAAPTGEKEITISGIDYNADATTQDVYRVKVDSHTGDVIVVDDSYVPQSGEALGVYTPATGEISFDVDVPQVVLGTREDPNTNEIITDYATYSKYAIKIEYYPVNELVSKEGTVVAEDKASSIERILKINGSIPFAEARYLTLSKVWSSLYKLTMEKNQDGSYKDVTPYVEAAARSGLDYEVAADSSYIIINLPEGGWTDEIVNKMTESDLRLFTSDIDGNEIRPSMLRVPEWRTYECSDVDGFYSESFEFLLYAGRTNTISLQAKNQPMVIKNITLYPLEESRSYEDILKEYEAKGYKKGTGSVKFEAEYVFSSSSQTVYPIEDPSSALTSPSNTSHTVLNTIGGDKWQTSGQWLRYKFSVDADGLYQIVARYRQNINDGMFSSRALRIYSEGLAEGADGYYNGSPFTEAANLRFDYSTDWQVGPLMYAKRTVDGNNNSQWKEIPLEFYFKEGVTYTIELEVSLGDMGDIVSRVSNSLSNINSYYLDILKLTGADPDEYRDYGFYRIMPDTMAGLLVEADNLTLIAKELADIAGAKSSNVATLERVAWLLSEMGKDEDNVAKYLDQLKSYIGTLGTWVSTAKTQPLGIDYFLIQSSDAELPPANANFFESLWHEITRFFQSFFRNYDRMGATTQNSEGNETVEVWLAYGRDQTQVIRNLINNQFTPETGHLVDLKLVNAGALLPSILAGSGPDVYIGVTEDNIINYAIRGALLNVENYDGFNEITNQYVKVKKNISDLVAELEADNYIIEGKGTPKILAKSGDGVTMYTITFSSDNSGEVTDRNGNHYCYFDKNGDLYNVGDNFEGSTYVYNYKLDENGNKIKNENAQFNDAAMYVLGLEDTNGIMHYYGLPETQNFAMMFVRNDILADLGLEIPKSWDDIEAAIPVLQSKNMQIGMSNDYKVFLYQQGGELFADNGMRINLDSNLALESFEYMCNLFTMYSFPYKYDFANRFRTGEIPIGIATYNATYNQLVVFATEIRGLWSFYPLPGIATYETNEDGDFIYEDGEKVVKSINNQAVSTVTAIAMINGCDAKTAAWDYMKWYVGEDCQVNYSNEMVAILGDSAKHPTANIKALESMPWSTDEYNQLSLQFENLASIPNYPGAYIVSRYTQFSFLAAYDDLASPTNELLSYITLINKEITRKREEFDLETLELGKTLADKRVDEINELLSALDSTVKTKYATEIALINAALAKIPETTNAVPDKDIALFTSAADALRQTQYSDFYELADKLDEIAECFKDYQASY